MLAGGGIRPFARRSFAALWSFKAHEHRAAWIVENVADQPIAALAATVREVMTAHGFGVARELARQFECVPGQT
jgi:hypothetical protein